MHPEEIKAAMRIAGTTPAMLADALDVSKATVSTVIHGRAESARVKASISKLIGKPVSVIWPGAARKSLQRPKGSVKPRARAHA
ncbi:helix-turn-helix domain-containing protein [Thermomonas sp.]|uniref:helix-turn-helix domain-containing protein n=1 Tax=Thermomonas sp. TaxID=1971895 RepID=UPI0035AE193E